MTTPTLADLVFNGKTKVNGEVFVFYNLGVGQITSYSAFDGTAVVTTDEIDCTTGSAPVCPENPFVASVVWAENAGSFGVWGAKPPLYAADTGTIAPTALGDVVANICLPDPADDVMICYDQGLECKPGVTFKAVPRKFNPADHYVRQRPENSITATDLLVSNTTGINRIAGRRVTIIVKIIPNGAGAPTEIQYYCGVLFNPNLMNSGADSNGSATLQFQGNFTFAACFSSAPGG